MLYGHEPDTSRFEDVQGIHVGRADDAEDVSGVVGHHRFNERLARSHQGWRLSPSRGRSVLNKNRNG